MEKVLVDYHFGYRYFELTEDFKVSDLTEEGLRTVGVEVDPEYFTEHKEDAVVIYVED